MTENKDTNSRFFLMTSFVVVMLCWLEVLIFWKKIPPQLPWFYSLPWGEVQLMKKSGLIWMLSGVTILSLMTSYLPKWTKNGDQIVERAIFITMTLAAVLLMLTLTKVLFIFIG